MYNNRNGLYARTHRLPKCDICGEEALYDARLSIGSWANVCSDHFNLYECSLGVGRGQQYVLPFESLSDSAQKNALRNIRSNIADEEGYCNMSDIELANYIIEGLRYFFVTGEVCE
jgi:hypothetical protein